LGYHSNTGELHHSWGDYDQMKPIQNPYLSALKKKKKKKKKKKIPKTKKKL